jgi:hypothetical protein
MILKGVEVPTLERVQRADGHKDGGRKVSRIVAVRLRVESAPRWTSHLSVLSKKSKVQLQRILRSYRLRYVSVPGRSRPGRDLRGAVRGESL